MKITMSLLAVFCVLAPVMGKERMKDACSIHILLVKAPGNWPFLLAEQVEKGTGLKAVREQSTEDDGALVLETWKSDYYVSSVFSGRHVYAQATLWLAGRQRMVWQKTIDRPEGTEMIGGGDTVVFHDVTANEGEMYVSLLESFVAAYRKACHK